MEKFTYRPQNVCPVSISFDLEETRCTIFLFSAAAAET